MKTNNSNVAHVWASGRVASVEGSNFFANGPTLYSYGTHFVVGHLMPSHYDRDGRRVVLLNSDSYGTTTSKHQSYARDAVSHLYVCNVALSDPMVRAVHHHTADLRASLMLDVKRHADIAASPRRKSSTVERAVRDARTALDWFAHFAAVDARRCTGELRKRARADLRTAYSLGALLTQCENDHTGDAYAAFAGALNAAEWREGLAIEYARIIRNADAVAGNVDTAQWRMASYAIDSVSAACNHGRELLSRLRAAGVVSGRYRMPRAVRAALDLIEKHRAAVVAGVRGDDLRDAFERVDWVAREMARDHMSDNYAYTLHDRLSEAHTTIGDDGDADARAERERMLSELSRRIVVSRAAQRLSDATTQRDMARTHARTGEWREAARWATRAMDKARDAARDYRTQCDYQSADTCDAIADECETIARDAVPFFADEDARALESWRRGERGNVPDDLHEMRQTAFLRVRGDDIETSRGARVPLSVAPMLWRVVRGAHAGRDMREAIGSRVGLYRLDDVCTDGSLVIGCHRIAYDELHAMACRLGYAETCETADA